MTDLGGRLQGPEKAELSAELRSRLALLKRQVQAGIDGGLPPESAVRYTKVREALVAAEFVVLLAGTSPASTASDILP